MPPMEEISWKERFFRLEERFIKLEEENRALKEEVRALQEKLNTNCSNSSKPPSQDPFKAKRKTSPSGKQRGGQPGHPGHKRRLYPEAELTTNIDIKPTMCSHCQSTQFDATPASIEVRQVVELPPIHAEVSQYNIYTCCCSRCGKHVRAEMPPEAQGGFGPRLMGFLTLLSGECHLTKRKICALAAHLGIRISLGALCKIHHLASEILEHPYEAIKKSVLQGAHVNGDETGWRTCNQRRWLWIGVGKAATFFSIDPSRSQEAFNRIFDGFQNTLTSDRYGAYNTHMGNKQTCLAHLDRDIEKVKAREGLDGGIGKILSHELTQVFTIWREIKEGGQTRKVLQERMQIHVQNIESALKVGASADGITKKTSRFCHNILSRFESLWTFLYEEEVEPTNNRAERGLRPAVIMRKLSGGNQSEWGERFTERVFTVVCTLKQQSQNILDYFNRAFHAHIRASPIPSA